ncbi:amino acid ABC transporter permease [Psychromonas sp.]|uniref:amino acid ABC transporter permease n=1 Tax=Psychromonas sp. TaxID=1884585 RepID=UPI003A975975
MDTLTFIQPYIFTLLKGVLITLEVSISSFGIGLIMALFMAPLSIYGSRYIQLAIKIYVDIFRGLPELLIIFFFFYGGTVALTNISGSYFEVSALAAGIGALAIVASAYLTEILRAALLSLDKGQLEASYAFGFTPLQTFRLIVLPQSIKLAAPGMANQWLVSLKESALVSVIGLEELMRVTVVSAGSTQQHLLFYTIAAALYLLISYISQVIINSMQLGSQLGRG